MPELPHIDAIPCSVVQEVPGPSLPATSPSPTSPPSCYPPVTPVSPRTKQLVSDIKAKKKGQDGSVALNFFAGKSDAFCLSEAPNADVVHKHHEALGIKLDKGQIYEVQALV